MVFETGKAVSPEFARAKVSVVELVGKVHMYSFDIFGKDGRARPESYCQELWAVGLV